MPLPREVLDSIKEDIDKAKTLLAELREVITDMRLSGMDTAKQDDQFEALSTEIRHLEGFYERQRVKSEGQISG